MSHAARPALAIRAAALASAALALVAASSGEARASQPESPALDLAELAASSRTVAIDEAKLRAALVKGKPEGVLFSTALDLGGGKSAVAWAECDQKVCRGYLATLSGGAGAPKLEKRASLLAPAKVFAIDGYVFQAIAYTDLDGDGASEILIGYRTTEPPRRALGSWVREYVAVYAPEDLSVAFSKELRKHGADTEEACVVELSRHGDRLNTTSSCDQRMCLGASPRPVGCKGTKVKFEMWKKAKGTKRYVRTKP